MTVRNFKDTEPLVARIESNITVYQFSIVST